MGSMDLQTLTPKEHPSQDSKLHEGRFTVLTSHDYAYFVVIPAPIRLDSVHFNSQKFLPREQFEGLTSHRINQFLTEVDHFLPSGR